MNNNNKGLFITGTGTDIGKTFITALLAKSIKQAGIDVGYFKAAVSGNSYINGKLIPGDAQYVKTMANLSQSLDQMVPYVYEKAYSPHLAAQIEGNPVNIERIKKDLDSCQQTHELVLMEGSGGILCPIRFDNEEIWLEDIIKLTGYPSIIVADAGLGTINHVLLTIHYMQSKDLPIAGIIYNNYENDNILHQDNIYMIEEKSSIKTLAKVSKNASEIDVNTIISLLK